MAFQSLLVVLLFAALGHSVAAESPETLVAILNQQRALEADLAADTVGLTPRQLGVVRNAQAEILKLTEGKTSMEQLNIEEKIRLDMALERINTQIEGGDLNHTARGKEDVCKRVKRTGESMKSTMCATQAEWDQMRAAGRELLERPRVCADCKF